MREGGRSGAKLNGGGTRGHDDVRQGTGGPSTTTSAGLEYYYLEH